MDIYLTITSSFDSRLLSISSNMFIVGLTGGIATGKSTVLNFFRENGISVVDADQIAREIVEPGQPSWEKIVKEFGTEVLDETGCIDRNVLGRIVFDDYKKRRILNEITHPYIQINIIKFTIKKFFEGHPFIIIELPLLFETRRMIFMIHKIITVVCDDSHQLERLCNRNCYSIDIAIKRITAQMPLEDKIVASNFIINNRGSLDSTRLQTINIIKLLKKSNFHWYIRSIISTIFIIGVFILFYILRFFFH